ncbi:Hsp20/alpha crystallin family protein [Myxococcus stipitatus]|uniref:Hsp20/alpha crystallin family protein n=1 Tax=Myxococcus stipitatus TaxID=83455 RepID=UPI001F454AE8|nr:Hsp20/alpha crystallin family protein [Myxococcus stipitatus]MCE9671022.1 Hsp20/alpha crystallin family protein [Myxococcus stipitatus]
MADITRREGSIPRRERDPFSRMQELMGWDPLEAMSQLWSGQRGGGPGASAFSPAFEVKETKDAFIFKADLPGVREKDLDIALTGDRLVISGKREAEKTEDDEHFFSYERSFGAFSRAFTLPEGVDPDHVSANLQDGVLHLTLPKVAEVKSRRIKVGTSSGSGTGASAPGDKPKA